MHHRKQQGPRGGGNKAVFPRQKADMGHVQQKHCNRTSSYTLLRESCSAAAAARPLESMQAQPAGKHAAAVLLVAGKAAVLLVLRWALRHSLPPVPLLLCVSFFLLPAVTLMSLSVVVVIE